MMLRFRTKLLLAFFLVVGIVGIVETLTGFSFISRTVIAEAMRRVEMDLNSAWAAFEQEKSHVQIVLGMASQSEALRSAVRSGTDLERLEDELEALRQRHDLDFLNVVDHQGFLLGHAGVDRATFGDRWADPVIQRALTGAASSGTILMPSEVLKVERGELAERAFIPLVYTEKATPSSRTVETRGMVVEAAIPVIDGGDRIRGAVYGGVLINRKFALVDDIRNVVFGEMTHAGRPVGTVTFFLDDVRIATNVMLDAATRALGTRVSEEVKQKVLDDGERFADRAFVVNDWYLSAYDPIRDPNGKIIGIIYVGLLEKKYLEYKSSLAMEYLGISLLAFILALIAALYLSSGFRRPILRLVQATRELSSGNLETQVEIGRASKEIGELAHAFNTMAQGLSARTRELERTSHELKEAYSETREKNRAYLEMLGFVTHELKSPLASIVFAIGALRDRILGGINPEQESALRTAAASADYLQDTIANYLNLSRIEEGEIRLALKRVFYLRDVIMPVVERITELATEHGIAIECEVPEQMSGTCDPSLMTAVFQNLVSNAVKYGRDGGVIRITGERNDERASVHFSVWNQGEGFDRESGERLFQKFSRLREGDETKAGTGLGLFVSQQLIVKHGGRVWAESEPGEWARFDFELPVDPLTDPKVKATLG
jgi:two-component system NtrC family sensor kinase